MYKVFLTDAVSEISGRAYEKYWWYRLLVTSHSASEVVMSKSSLRYAGWDEVMGETVLRLLLGRR